MRRARLRSLRALLRGAVLLSAVPCLAQDARVHELHEVDALPRALNAPALVDALAALYPDVPPERAFSGVVTVSMVVSADGVPLEASVVEPGDSAFDAATLTAVGVLRFVPGKVGGRNVPVRVMLPVTWAYRDEAPPAELAAADAEQARLDSALVARFGEIMGMEMVSDPPQPTNIPTFQRALTELYPANLRDTGGSGSVTVEFVVGVDGRPYNIHVVRTTSDAFSQATVQAVQRLRFRPARLDGRPVPVRVTLPVEWQAEPGWGRPYYTADG